MSRNITQLTQKHLEFIKQSKKQKLQIKKHYLNYLSQYAQIIQNFHQHSQSVQSIPVPQGFSNLQITIRSLRQLVQLNYLDKEEIHSMHKSFSKLILYQQNIQKVIQVLEILKLQKFNTKQVNLFHYLKFILEHFNSFGKNKIEIYKLFQTQLKIEFFQFLYVQGNHIHFINQTNLDFCKQNGKQLSPCLIAKNLMLKHHIQKKNQLIYHALLLKLKFILLFPKKKIQMVGLILKAVQIICYLNQKINPPNMPCIFIPPINYYSMFQQLYELFKVQCDPKIHLLILQTIRKILFDQTRLKQSKIFSAILKKLQYILSILKDYQSITLEFKENKYIVKLQPTFLPYQTACSIQFMHIFISILNKKSLIKFYQLKPCFQFINKNYVVKRKQNYWLLPYVIIKDIHQCFIKSSSFFLQTNFEQNFFQCLIDQAGSYLKEYIKYYKQEAIGFQEYIIQWKTISDINALTILMLKVETINCILKQKISANLRFRRNQLALIKKIFESNAFLQIFYFVFQEWNTAVKNKEVNKENILKQLNITLSSLIASICHQSPIQIQRVLSLRLFDNIIKIIDKSLIPNDSGKIEKIIYFLLATTLKKSRAEIIISQTNININIFKTFCDMTYIREYSEYKQNQILNNIMRYSSSSENTTNIVNNCFLQYMDCLINKMNLAAQQLDAFIEGKLQQSNYYFINEIIKFSFKIIQKMQKILLIQKKKDFINKLVQYSKYKYFLLIGYQHTISINWLLQSIFKQVKQKSQFLQNQILLSSLNLKDLYQKQGFKFYDSILNSEQNLNHNKIYLKQIRNAGIILHYQRLISLRQHKKQNCQNTLIFYVFLKRFFIQSFSRFIISKKQNLQQVLQKYLVDDQQNQNEIKQKLCRQYQLLEKEFKKKNWINKTLQKIKQFHRNIILQFQQQNIQKNNQVQQNLMKQIIFTYQYVANQINKFHHSKFQQQFQQLNIIQIFFRQIGQIQNYRNPNLTYDQILQKTHQTFWLFIEKTLNIINSFISVQKNHTLQYALLHFQTQKILQQFEEVFQGRFCTQNNDIINKQLTQLVRFCYKIPKQPMVLKNIFLYIIQKVVQKLLNFYKQEKKKKSQILMEWLFQFQVLMKSFMNNLMQIHVYDLVLSIKIIKYINLLPIQLKKKYLVNLHKKSILTLKEIVKLYHPNVKMNFGITLNVIPFQFKIQTQKPINYIQQLNTLIQIIKLLLKYKINMMQFRKQNYQNILQFRNQFFIQIIKLAIYILKQLEKQQVKYKQQLYNISTFILRINMFIQNTIQYMKIINEKNKISNQLKRNIKEKKHKKQNQRNKYNKNFLKYICQYFNHIIKLKWILYDLINLQCILYFLIYLSKQFKILDQINFQNLFSIRLKNIKRQGLLNYLQQITHIILQQNLINYEVIIRRFFYQQCKQQQSQFVRMDKFNMHFQSFKNNRHFRYVSQQLCSYKDSNETVNFFFLNNQDNIKNYYDNNHNFIKLKKHQIHKNNKYKIKMFGNQKISDYIPQGTSYKYIKSIIQAIVINFMQIFSKNNNMELSQNDKKKILQNDKAFSYFILMKILHVIIRCYPANIPFILKFKCKKLIFSQLQMMSAKNKQNFLSLINPKHQNLSQITFLIFYIRIILTLTFQNHIGFLYELMLENCIVTYSKINGNIPLVHQIRKKIFNQIFNISQQAIKNVNIQKTIERSQLGIIYTMSYFTFILYCLQIKEVVRFLIKNQDDVNTPINILTQYFSYYIHQYQLFKEISQFITYPLSILYCFSLKIIQSKSKPQILKIIILNKQNIYQQLVPSNYLIPRNFLSGWPYDKAQQLKRNQNFDQNQLSSSQNQQSLGQLSLSSFYIQGQDNQQQQQSQVIQQQNNQFSSIQNSQLNNSDQIVEQSSHIFLSNSYQEQEQNIVLSQLLQEQQNQDLIFQNEDYFLNYPQESADHINYTQLYGSQINQKQLNIMEKYLQQKIQQLVNKMQFFQSEWKYLLKLFRFHSIQYTNTIFKNNKSIVPSQKFSFIQQQNQNQQQIQDQQLVQQQYKSISIQPPILFQNTPNYYQQVQIHLSQNNIQVQNQNEDEQSESVKQHMVKRISKNYITKHRKDSNQIFFKDINMINKLPKIPDKLLQNILTLLNMNQSDYYSFPFYLFIGLCHNPILQSKLMDGLIFLLKQKNLPQVKFHKNINQEQFPRTIMFKNLNQVETNYEIVHNKLMLKILHLLSVTTKHQINYFIQQKKSINVLQSIQYLKNYSQTNPFGSLVKLIDNQEMTQNYSMLSFYIKTIANIANRYCIRYFSQKNENKNFVLKLQREQIKIICSILQCDSLETNQLQKLSISIVLLCQQAQNLNKFIEQMSSLLNKLCEKSLQQIKCKIQRTEQIINFKEQNKIYNILLIIKQIYENQNLKANTQVESNKKINQIKNQIKFQTKQKILNKLSVLLQNQSLYQLWKKSIELLSLIYQSQPELSKKISKVIQSFFIVYNIKHKEQKMTNNLEQIRISQMGQSIYDIKEEKKFDNKMKIQFQKQENILNYLCSFGKNIFNIVIKQQLNNIKKNKKKISILKHPISIILNKFSQFIEFKNKCSMFRIEMNYIKRKHKNTKIYLEINRNNLFANSIDQIKQKTIQQLKYKFVINFFNQQGEDEGGLTRQWFQLLSRQIFNPNYALFVPSCTGNTFKPFKSIIDQDHLIFYKSIGRIVGKALMDNYLMQVFFTRSFYKHLIGQKLQFSDMQQQDYQYYKNMKWILQNNITGVLDLTFTYLEQNFGQITNKELIQNGNNIHVTQQNKHQYVRLMCFQKMAVQIKSQIQSFLQGFYQLIPKKLISIFDCKQLQLMISGLPSIDIYDLKFNTQYVKYNQDDNVIIWLWQLLISFQIPMKANFIQFVTGTSRVPPQGFSGLRGINGPQKFNIHKAYNQKDLPRAHTWQLFLISFNQLDLPEYPSKQMLQKKICLAITQGKEGFGMI